MKSSRLAIPNGSLVADQLFFRADIRTIDSPDTNPRRHFELVRAMIHGATVIITDVGANISQTTAPYARGAYGFTALRRCCN